MPPLIARYALAPLIASLIESTSPALILYALLVLIGTVFIAALKCAPDNAIAQSSLKRAAIPMYVISSTASFGLFPISKFAVFAAFKSIAPHWGNPRLMPPNLPPSCTVVNSPGRTINMLTGAPPRYLLCIFHFQ